MWDSLFRGLKSTVLSYITNIVRYVAEHKVAYLGFIFVYKYIFEEEITISFSLLAPLIIKMTTTAPTSYEHNLDRQAQ